MELDKRGAELLFQVLIEREDKYSIAIASNESFNTVGEVFNDDIIVAATIDRLVHHAEVVPLKGDSYRTKNRPEQLASTTVKN